MLGRLHLIDMLLPTLGVASGGGGQGFSLDSLMRFLNAAFTSSNAEVHEPKYIYPIP